MYNEQVNIYLVYVRMSILGSFFFFKQKTAYEMRISDWSSDVCSSDLGQATISGGAQATFISDNFDNLMIAAQAGSTGALLIDGAGTTVTTTGVDNTVQVGWAGSGTLTVQKIGRGSWRERVCQYV